MKKLKIPIFVALFVLFVFVATPMISVTATNSSQPAVSTVSATVAPFILSVSDTTPLLYVPVNAINIVAVDSKKIGKIKPIPISATKATVFILFKDNIFTQLSVDSVTKRIMSIGAVSQHAIVSGIIVATHKYNIFTRPIGDGVAKRSMSVGAVSQHAIVPVPHISQKIPPAFPSTII